MVILRACTAAFLAISANVLSHACWSDSWVGGGGMMVWVCVLSVSIIGWVCQFGVFLVM